MRAKRIYAPPARAKPVKKRQAKARGTGPFYLTAFLATLLSLDTAARFFGGELGINGLRVEDFSIELAAVCGIGELTLLACGYAMRHNVRRNDPPGAAQLVAFAMCTAAAFMAFAVGGPVGGAVRTFFGPVTALVTLHLALRIELKVRLGEARGTWARIGRELRERALSRLGLADDARPALERTRDRAADRAARLAAGGWWFRKARLARAVRAAGVALDDKQKDRMLRQVAALKTLKSLIELESSSPWVLPHESAPAQKAKVERTKAPARIDPVTPAPPRRNTAGRPPSPERGPALEFVRHARAEGRAVSAADLMRRFTKSEGWARGVLTEAARHESPNGKVPAGL